MTDTAIRRRQATWAAGLCAIMIAAVAPTVPALAQGAAASAASATPVIFKAGSTRAVVRDSIRGDEFDDHLITGKAGDRLSVAMQTSNRSSYFNITAAGSDAAMFIGSTSGDTFDGALPADGNYTIRVYLMRNAARRKETARYTLTINHSGAVAAAPAADFADGLSGGPDYWQVAGLRRRDTLAMRHSPRNSAAAVSRLSQGAVVRNLGCRMTGQTRWCRVERLDDATQGWVAGRYLREGAPPTEGRRGDALVPGTRFNATGDIPCAIAASLGKTACTFGVTRGEAGVATVFITLPDGRKRVLGFSGGTARSLQAASSVTQSRASDNTIVIIDGGAERYTIPDALVNGG